GFRGRPSAAKAPSCGTVRLPARGPDRMRLAEQVEVQPSKPSPSLFRRGLAGVNKPNGQRLQLVELPQLSALNPAHGDLALLAIAHPKLVTAVEPRHHFAHMV